MAEKVVFEKVVFWGRFDPYVLDYEPVPICDFGMRYISPTSFKGERCSEPPVFIWESGEYDDWNGRERLCRAHARERVDEAIGTEMRRVADNPARLAEMAYIKAALDAVLKEAD